MFVRFAALLILAIASLTATAPAAPPAGGAQGGRGADRAAVDDETRAERLALWRAMSPEQRAEVRRRYEELQRLDPEARERTLSRARRFRAEVGRVLESLSPAEREAIERLAPAGRARVLRGIVADEARATAARLRATMTPEERARFADAGPEQRAEIVRSVRERAGERARGAARRLARELGVDAAQIEGMDRGEVRRRLVDLARRRARRHLEVHGPPEGLDADQWERVLGLPDRQFARAFGRVRARQPDYAAPPRGEPGPGRRGPRMHGELRGLGMPTPSDRARRPGADEAEHVRRAVSERRGRIERLLRERSGIDAALLERVEGLDDRAFFAAWRVMVAAFRSDADPSSALADWFDRGGARERVDSPRDGDGPERAQRRGRGQGRGPSGSSGGHGGGRRDRGGR